MSEVSIIFSKLAGIRPGLDILIKQGKRYYDPLLIDDYFVKYSACRDFLKETLPDLYADLIVRADPTVTDLNGNEGRGFIAQKYLEILLRDIDYIIEVRANSRIGEKKLESEKKDFIFISHGRSKDWHEVQAYVEKELKYRTIELAQQPNKGRTVLQKLDEESNKCNSAIIVMTGDDVFNESQTRVRENVMHEIGFFQGKLGLSNVILLYEEGVNLPSNIEGIIYVPFPKNYISATLGILMRELRVILE